MAALNNFLGEGSLFRGDCFVTGDLRLEGTIEGRIETPGTVFIGESGRCLGDIMASEVIVGGEIQGQVVAHGSLTLLGSGRIRGNIAVACLDIADKAVFQGFCRIAPRLFERHADESIREMHLRVLAALASRGTTASDTNQQ